ncbi:MAG: ABC transporter substrate-binding protein [Fluviicola sp.]|jgi:iron complex transport system substrate-binding protein
MKFLYFLLIFVFFSCASNDKNLDETNKTSVKYAENFELIERKDFLELRILNPEIDGVERKYALVKRGTNTSIPSDLEKIEVPIQKMGAFSTSFIGMIAELDACQSVAATTGENYIYNKTIKQQVKKKQTRCFSSEADIQAEFLLSKKINLLIYSGFGQDFPNEEKLKKIGVSCIPNYDWREQHPLAKAEWIKFFGALLDKQEMANSYFGEVEKNYLSLQKKLKKSKVSKPKVLVGLMFGDTWNAPAGQSFLARILADSQIDYLYKKEKGTGSLSLSLEKVAVNQANCSIWLDANARSKSELIQTNSKFKVFKAYQNNKIYSYSHAMNYFWEMNSLHPDWLLEDYAQIAGHLPAKKLHFYKRIN